MVNKLLTINIRNYLVNVPRRKRPMKVSTYVRGQVSRYSKIMVGNVKLSKELNVIIMKEHIKSMHPLKVNISIEKEQAMVTPFQQKAPAAKPTETKATAPTAKTTTPKPAATATQPAKAVKKEVAAKKTASDQAEVKTS
jgi:hypothetical protein